MTLKQRALAIGSLSQIQDMLGLGDMEFAEFLVQEAALMAPGILHMDSDDDEDDEPSSSTH